MRCCSVAAFGSLYRTVCTFCRRQGVPNGRAGAQPQGFAAPGSSEHMLQHLAVFEYLLHHVIPLSPKGITAQKQEQPNSKARKSRLGRVSAMHAYVYGN